MHPLLQHLPDYTKNRSGEPPEQRITVLEISVYALKKALAVALDEIADLRKTAHHRNTAGDQE